LGFLPFSFFSGADSLPWAQLDLDNLIVKGTSTALEKPYLRLTSAPAPSDVRPEPVLKQALQHIKSEYSKGREYLWVWEQFKSLRQDLRVQHIRNSFTADVYEINGRLALRNDDLGEFNQCKTQLEALYDDPSLPRQRRVAEMCAYWILYHMFTNNAMANGKLLLRLPPKIVSCGDKMRWPIDDAKMRGLRVAARSDQKNDDSNNSNNSDSNRRYLVVEDDDRQSLLHALCMRRALALGNDRRFFQLARGGPNFSRFLLGKFLPNERRRALATMATAYGRTAIPLALVATELGFGDAGEEEGVEDAREFCEENGVVFVQDDPDQIDAGKTAARLR
jgi:SAC3 family protein LENG8/THP3